MKRFILLFFILSLIISNLFSEEINWDWLAIDRKIIIAFQEIVNRKAFTIKEIEKIYQIDDIREITDLGFGGVRTEAVIYGGYMSLWIKIIQYKENTFLFEAYIDADSMKKIQPLLDKEKKIKQIFDTVFSKNISTANFTFRENKKESEYFLNVAMFLGSLSELDLPEEMQESYDFLLYAFNDTDYGSYCYYQGIEPKGRIAFNTLLSLNNINIFRNLLRGYSPEGRRYAIDGIILLSNQQEPSILDQESYNKLVKCKLKYSSCAGCEIVEEYYPPITELFTNIK